MKPKHCKTCNTVFTPQKYLPSQTKCKACIFAHHKAKLCEYEANRLAKPKKIDTKWIEISKAVRKRDAGLPCISCGKQMKDGEIDAGHYISRKCTTLYYDLRNIHAQCRHCNVWEVDKAKVQTGYRNGLVARYGLQFVVEVEVVWENERKIVK